MSSEFKVSDDETRTWIESLSENEKIELKRRALEKRAIELLQPDKGAPQLGNLTDAEFAAYKRSLGIG